jgi:hypothetical protein
VRLLLDADALIKLNRAGVLETILEALDCVAPEAVYDEVVTEGRARKYADADVIGEMLSRLCDVVKTRGSETARRGLGRGELAVLELANHERDATVVSDDRDFLAVLDSLNLESLMPAGLLVVLARTRTISLQRADDALEKMRGLISVQNYDAARSDLASIRGERHEED